MHVTSVRSRAHVFNCYKAKTAGGMPVLPPHRIEGRLVLILLDAEGCMLADGRDRGKCGCR